MIGDHRLTTWVMGRTILMLFVMGSVTPVVGDEEPGLTQTKPTSGRYVRTARGYMVPYRMQIPGTDVEFEMVPVPGGTVRLGGDGGPTDSSNSPVVEVKLEPFWLGKYEVTWAEYNQYYNLRHAFARFQQLGIRKVTARNQVDAITAPSSVYIPPTPVSVDESEWPRHPAVAMTQFGAKQYTKWLSKLTGDFYRLPSEAEWVFACRAGSSSRFSFGDDESRLGEYAWYFANSDEDTHPVGTRKPNTWGLHDMHGNVTEWVLDQFDRNHDGLRQAVARGAAPIHWPTRLHPRTVCGGSWDSDAADCASVARLASSKDWQVEDPQLPTSPHWLACSEFRQFGFRIARPLTKPPSSSHARFWDVDVDELREALNSYSHVQSGLVDPDLPAAIRQLQQ